MNGLKEKLLKVVKVKRGNNDNSPQPVELSISVCKDVFILFMFVRLKLLCLLIKKIEKKGMTEFEEDCRIYEYTSAANPSMV